MKYPASTCPDEALTVLVNERKAYELMLKGVKYLYTGGRDYDCLRFHIYHACKDTFANYSTKDQILTTQLVPRVCEYYWQEVTGHEWEEEDEETLYKITPDWARKQLDRKPKERIMTYDHNFKIGDKVKIVKSIPTSSVGWIPAMDAYVNNNVVYTVSNIYPKSVRFKELDWAWPHDALELVADSTTRNTQTKKESIVANPKVPVEHITFVFGVERKDVTDDQIFEHIRNLENQIKDLEKIDNKPKKLKDKINSLKNNIDDLIKLVDGDTVTE